MIYSKTCEYALRALAFLAGKGSGGTAMIPEISERTGVPSAYIAKIFGALTKKKILRSRRGPQGGFAFHKDPGKLSLFEIVTAIDAYSPLGGECVMGLKQCGDKNACPLHDIWRVTREKIKAELKRSTLDSLKPKLGENRYRGLKRGRLGIVF